MNDSLSLSLAVSQEKEPEASLSSLTEDQRRSPVLSTLFLSLLHAYIYIYTHTHTYRVGYILGVPDHIILWCE